MDLAYPNGPDSIPEKKRVYCNIDEPIDDYLPPGDKAQGVCQVARNSDGNPCGYAFRLGSVHYPHLKLLLRNIATRNGNKWVCMVDTHDAFSRQSIVPPPNHPDAEAWLQLQQANQQLKEKIEHALADAGLVTFNSLLRDDLDCQ